MIHNGQFIQHVIRKVPFSAFTKDTYCDTPVVYIYSESQTLTD